MVLIEQISALIDYLENHQDLALGHCSRTSEGRSLSKRLWTECAQNLNCVSVDCPKKTPAEWRTFYNEYKSKLFKKIKSQKTEVSATGGIPVKNIRLTPLQERLYTVLRRGVREPLPGARNNPPTPTITRPVVDASPTASNNLQLENNSFSLSDSCEGAVYVKVENIEAGVKSKEENNVEDQPSTNHQPPKRRLCYRSARRYAVDGRYHATLEAVQSRLDAIEARNAEATLQHAQATNNLAVAINRLGSTTEKFVDLIGHFVSSVTRKKCRSIVKSSDSESD